MNKTLKILTVGALALTGSLAFSGCMADDAKITADEKTQIMTTVENSNKFMENVYSTAQEENEILKQQLAEEKFKNATQNALFEERNELLEKELEELKANNAAQNEILEDKNAILQEKNELLEQQLAEEIAKNEAQNKLLEEKNELLKDEILILQAQNAEQIKEKAKELIRFASSQLKLNFNGVRDNLKIEATLGKDEASISCYTFESGKGAMLIKQGEDGNLYYDDDKVVFGSTLRINNEGETAVIIRHIADDGSLQKYSKQTEFALIDSYDVGAASFVYYDILDNIVSVEINQNGNYVITCNKLDSKNYMIYQAEITPDAKFVMEKSITKDYEECRIYEYGNVNVNELIDLISKAEEFEPNPYFDDSDLQFRPIFYGASGDVGDFLYNFGDLKFYYYEDGEVKVKYWNSYDEFIADGGTCSGFDTNNSYGTCYFTYNGISASCNYTVIMPEE